MKLGLGPVSLAGATRASLVALADAAVAASFDAIWIAEARAEGLGGGVAAAAFLAQEVPIRVGAALDFGGYHPLYAAEDIAVADIASRGRVEVLLRGGSSEQRRLLVEALSGAHLRFDGEALQVPARLEANQPTPERLALNPRPLQPVVPVWVEDVDEDEARALGTGIARRWRPGAAPPAVGRWPGMVLCPGEVAADHLLRAAGDAAPYFLVGAVTPDEVVSTGRRLVGPLRMPGFPDWINQQ
jgi:hypothetical protein